MTIVGSIPREEGEEPLWIVYLEGQETDRGEYWWSVNAYLTVTRDAEGKEVVDDATDKQVKQVTGESESANGRH